MLKNYPGFAADIKTWPTDPAQFWKRRKDSWPLYVYKYIMKQKWNKYIMGVI